MLYTVYQYVNVDLGLFLSLNSFILFLKSEQEKQANQQDSRIDKLETATVSRSEYYELLFETVKLKAALDLLRRNPTETTTETVYEDRSQDEGDG
ncbi:MAG: hypothetical protein RIM23_09965 [Coleofasciculus sp. G3-WIS-01]|uniref:hypothetical protein n=1 Tax=Coleofasciculus sp. G3-WIS-01 TaxID=3069528 RepID=UPI003305223E